MKYAPPIIGAAILAICATMPIWAKWLNKGE